MNTVNIENFLNTLKGKRIAFFGAGVSNLLTIELLSKVGLDICVCDAHTREQLGPDTCKKLDSLNIPLNLGAGYLDNIDFDVIFRTPGMSFFHESLVKARKKGTVVTSEMEVFFDLCPCMIVGITGSDGKTTTSTIISNMLKESGKTVHLGGNIGTPLLPIICEINKTDVVVVELSSFQLISMRRSPDVAVVTNISPNHLDIHKDMAEYISAKKNIIMHQNAFSRTVLNLDNKITGEFGFDCRGDVRYFSKTLRPTSGAYLGHDGMIYLCNAGHNDQAVVHKSEIKIPGIHNIENYLAAISSLSGYVEHSVMRKVAMSFGGVEHRTEFVRELDGVRYYNDSIASSPTRTALGTLSLYGEKIILIAGGYDKKIPFEQLGTDIVAKVKVLILMGQTADKIETSVKSSTAYIKGNPVILRVQSMEEAISTARNHACPGDVVSLSPACASFDLYKNFSERGEHFKTIVNGL